MFLGSDAQVVRVHSTGSMFAWLFAVGLICGVLPDHAAAAPGDQSPDRVWTQVDPGRAPSVLQAAVLPSDFSLFTVNGQTLNVILDAAPQEFAFGPEVILTLPMPDGTFQRFRIEETALLSPEMQAENPDIRTYVGQGIDDPTATVRIDVTMFGFRAQVLSAGGTILIDPVVRGQTGTVMSFFKRDFPQPEEPFECAVPITGEEDYRGVPRAAAWGETLRTYRLAVTATGEYTNQMGGPAGADAQITTTVNRVTGIYERDLAIRLNLVATNLFTDSTTDPFDTTANDALLDANRTVCNDSVGLANYDIGHLFGASAGGGKGDIGSVCTANKARGATLRDNPTGDPFDVDYVAHEIGHQFGGNHTFNGSTSNCGGARTDHSAYEPGSGTTIMAYAGICGAENIQANSDPYFHARSLDQILTFREGTGNCGAPTATGNTPPTANAGGNITIPRGTPFYLEGIGSDANGDAITYCWEQYNLGPASPPTSMASGPIFRSRPPSTNDFRFFPQLSDWVNNAATPWEQLPTVDRTMTFRLTVRDNRANGGGVAWDDMTVTVAGAPFMVNSPNGGENLSAGCPVTVTWTVGGGSVSPNVVIWLSTDGGLTQSHNLGTTANDGSHEVTLPCVNTNQARIFVFGLGNNFFDCSNTNFTITSNSPTIAGSAVGGAVDGTCSRTVTFSATVDDDCNVSTTDVNVTASVVSSAASLGPLNVLESQASSDQVGITGSVNVFGLTASPATVRITVSAQDACGNTANRVLEATVTDQTPPTITCPVDLTFECDDIGSFGTPSSTDNCDPSPDLSITQRDSVPGDCPQEYTLTLTHQAMDFAGNTATCQQVIQVIDTTPPVLTCYDTLGFVFTSPTEANVYWDASAVDNCAPTPTVACVPPSGTLFGIGEHTVNCDADDGCGNTSACSFKFRLVPLDVHPTSCPNPINLKASGGPMALLPVAILGTADFSVADVNLATVRLNGVAPVQRRFEDISTPVANDPSTGCECTTAGKDGRMDLTLRFALEDIIATLPVGMLIDGQTIMLQVTGELNDGTPFAGGDCGTIRTKPKSLVTTEGEVSGISELTAWNSPNPFNPTTMISYQLPKSGHVRLTVYNLLGQEVGMPVDQWQEAGEYAVEWSGASAASGVYFYRIETAAGELRRKMLLLK